VEHRRQRVGFDQRIEGQRKPWSADRQHLLVGPDQEVLVTLVVRPLALRPGGIDDRQMVEHDGMSLDGEAATLVELGCAAQIDHRAQTEGLKGDDICSGQAIQAIGTEQRTPARRAAIGGPVATEVAKVVHGLQGHQAIRIVGGLGK
jgi:hypothetical protein